jgi:hypothetical protein
MRTKRKGKKGRKKKKKKKKGGEMRYHGEVKR